MRDFVVRGDQRVCYLGRIKKVNTIVNQPWTVGLFGNSTVHFVRCWLSTARELENNGMLIYSSSCSRNEQHHMHRLGSRHSSGVWERCQTSDRICFRLSSFSIHSRQWTICSVPCSRSFICLEIARFYINKIPTCRKVQFNRWPSQWTTVREPGWGLHVAGGYKDEQKFTFAHHVPYRIFEVQSNCFLVIPVDQPLNFLISCGWETRNIGHLDRGTDTCVGMKFTEFVRV